MINPSSSTTFAKEIVLPAFSFKSRPDKIEDTISIDLFPDILIMFIALSLNDVEIAQIVELSIIKSPK